MVSAGARGALIAFSVQVGAKQAIAMAAPLAAAAAGWLVLQYDPAGALRGFALSLFGSHAGALVGAGPALTGVAMAGWAVPRIRQGLAGWLRHLPVSGRDLRRAATIALVVAQTPLLVALLALALVAWAASSGIVWANVLSIPALAAAAALLLSPAQRPWVSRPLAGVALLVSFSGSWPQLGGAVVLVVIAELVAGGLPARRAATPRRGQAARGLSLRIALRALGPRTVVAYLAAALPIGAMLLFRANNELDASVAAGAVRLGGGIAVTALLAALAEPMAVRRPAWPWARSLPWSARGRVAHDVAMLFGTCLPLLVTAAWVEPSSLPPLCGLTGLLAIRAAGALRRAPERRTGAAGEVLAEGAFLAAWVALVPLLAWLLAGLIPVALRLAAERERSQRVSRWLALHHQAAGDPLSWSAE